MQCVDTESEAILTVCPSTLLSAMFGNNILESSSTVTRRRVLFRFSKKNLHYDPCARAVCHLAAYHAACLHRLTCNIQLSTRSDDLSVSAVSFNIDSFSSAFY